MAEPDFEEFSGFSLELLAQADEKYKVLTTIIHSLERKILGSDTLQGNYHTTNNSSSVFNF